MSNYHLLETSIEDNSPVELYVFRYLDEEFFYTSARYNVSATIDGVDIEFYPENIRRGEGVNAQVSQNGIEMTTLSVSRTSNIAQIYMGGVSFNNPIRVDIYRKQYGTDFMITIISGVITQCTYTDSECELTVEGTPVLTRNIPVGALSYYCQNSIYDSKCYLNMNNYGVECQVDDWSGLKITSAEITGHEDGYYNDGFIKMGRTFRAVTEHSGNTIKIKYPIHSSDRRGSFTLYPGCDKTFATCHRRYGNTYNFSGIPYIAPYDVRRHPSMNNQSYWIDGNIVVRDTSGEILTPGL